MLQMPGAPPLVFLLHDYLTQRQVWPLTSALSSSQSVHYTNLISTIPVLLLSTYVFIYALFSFPYLFNVYLFIYVFIYLFIYLVDYSLCYWILNCRWPFKMLLLNENLYMHDSAVEGFYSFFERDGMQCLKADEFRWWCFV